MKKNFNTFLLTKIQNRFLQQNLDIIWKKLYFVHIIPSLCKIDTNLTENIKTACQTVKNTITIL